jgi:hypothetical protein
MGRKKGGSNAKVCVSIPPLLFTQHGLICSQAAIYCWYCGDDRTFADEVSLQKFNCALKVFHLTLFQGILIEHQRARHFKCNTCHKRMQTWSSLRLHCSAVHKVEISLVENAIPERADFPGVIVGMDGVPDDDWREQAVQAEKRRKLEEAKVAAGVSPMPRPAPPPPPMMAMPGLHQHQMQQFHMQQQQQMPLHPPQRPPPPPGAPPMMPPSMTPPQMPQGMQLPPHYGGMQPAAIRPGVVGMGMPPPMYPPGMMRPPGPAAYAMPGMGMPMAPGMMQQQQFLQEQHMQQHIQNEQHEKSQQGYAQPPHQDQQQQSELQAAAAGSSSIPAAAASSAVAGVHMIYVDELTSMEERRASLSKYRHWPSLLSPPFFAPLAHALFQI